MTDQPSNKVPTPDQFRDDRTRRMLALVVGPDRADTSLTHFSVARVEVWVTSGVLEVPNGFLATAAILNMLSRFVGTVEVHAMGDLSPAVGIALDSTLAWVQQIDTREGRSVRRVSAGHDGSEARLPGDRTVVRVHLGDTPPISNSDGVVDAEQNVSIAFDGWTCAIRRGFNAGEIAASSVPFGALAAACFAVAEVFKTLVASCVSSEDLPAFRRRFTRDWRFSVWAMERVNGDLKPTGSPPVDSLPTLAIDHVLQVGAGAVGNAAALAFASTAAITGDLHVLDPKHMDLKNLNRCYYFTEVDVGATKAVVLERAAARAGLRVLGEEVGFTSAAARDATVLLSTVDNNEVRHRMQEVLPLYLVQGATGGTTAVVSVHSPGNKRSCLVCRHPDPDVGLVRKVPLSLAAAAAATGLSEEEIASGSVGGTLAISDEVIARVAARSAEVAAILRRARDTGQDLCGALGDLRADMGTISGPQEASVPFVSNLAGILAAAEVVKLLLRTRGLADVPLLDNVLQIDLARDYSRHARLAFQEPPRSDCGLCQGRAELVTHMVARRQ
jgi:molybdopterin/thiamine biosynthesis adenylyltransferase